MNELDELFRQWDRIRTWAKAIAPEALRPLNPPASPEALEALEHVLGCPLPAAYRAWLLLHDGERDERGVFAERILPASEVARAWRMHEDLRAQVPAFADAVDPAQVDPGVTPVWCSRTWVPITNNGSGDALCLDLGPAEGGVAGQIVRFFHDAPERRREAHSFVDLLRRHAEALEEGSMIATESDNPHDRGTFFAVMPRTALTGGLADLGVRGESEEEGQARRERYLRENPVELARRVVEALERDHGTVLGSKGPTPERVFAIMAVADALRQPHDSPSGRAKAVYAALATRVGGAALVCTPADIERVIPAIAAPAPRHV